MTDLNQDKINEAFEDSRIKAKADHEYNKKMRELEQEDKPKKKTVKKKEEEQEQIRTNMIIHEGKLYEQIYNQENKTSRFETVNSEPRTVTHLLEGKKMILPIEGEELEKGAVLLPSEAKEYGTTNELIKEIKKFIHSYVDIPEQYETFSAWYILLSWVYDRLNTINYMRVLGDSGLGKTRYLDTIGRLCYKATIIAGSITPAPIYRLISKWGGTLIIDEADWDGKNEEKSEIIKILNCGFQRGTPVARCDKERPDSIHFFNVFCPKIISTRQPFTDVALESRCITHRVYGTKRKDIPDSLGQKFYDSQTKLRNKLLMFRLKNYFHINSEEILDIDLGNVENRIKQATRGFASMFSQDPVMLEEFKEFLLRYNKELIESRAESFDGEIINAVVELIVLGERNISSKDVLRKLIDEGVLSDKSKTTPASIGRRLKTLKVSNVVRKVDGKSVRCLLLDSEFLEVVKRYVYDRDKVTLVTDVTEHAESEGGGSQELLDSYNNKKCFFLADSVSTVTSVVGVTEKAQNELVTEVTDVTDNLSDFVPQEEFLKGVFSDGEVLEWIKNHDVDGLGAYEGDLLKELDISKERLTRLTETGQIFEFKPGRYKTL